MTAAPVWLKSLRRRPAAFLVLLFLAVGATLVCTSTPLLLRVVDESAIRHAFSTAAFPRNGVSIAATTSSSVEAPAPEDAVRRALSRVRATGPFWGTPTVVNELQFAPRLVRGEQPPVLTHFTIAPDGCAGMQLSGRCPTNALEALLPRRLLGDTKWSPGTTVLLKTFDPSTGKLYTLAPIEIVGVYNDGTGIGRDLADPTRLVAQAPPRQTPNFVIGSAQSDQLGADLLTMGAARISSRISDADVPALHRAADVIGRLGLASDLGEASGTVSTQLDMLLQSIDDQQIAAAVLTTPVGVAAVLLAWASMGAIALRLARARALEWGVARMRGARRRSWAATVFAEPLSAILLGTSIGVLIAPNTVTAYSVWLIGETSEGAAPGAVWSGAGLALAGSLGALTVASLRGALLPLPLLLQVKTEPRRAGRPALVLQVVVIVLATAATWQGLMTPAFTPQQLGLLSPALLALAAAIVAVQGAGIAMRAATRQRPRSMTGLVVSRGLLRAPSGLFAAQLLVVGAALASFALQLVLSSSAVQTSRAELATGAAEVLTVRLKAGTSLLEAVDRADPTGRVAMAAEQITGDTSGTAGLLAVDTARVAAVSNWKPHWRSGVDLSGLRTESNNPPVLRGATALVQVRDARQGAAEPSTRALVVAQLVLARADRWFDVDLGLVREDAIRVSVPCRSGCRLVAVRLANSAGDSTPWHAQFTLEALSTDRQAPHVFASWLQSGRWRQRLTDRSTSGGGGMIAGSGSASGLRVTAVDRIGSAAPELEPAIGSALVPVVVASQTRLVPAAGANGAVTATSLSNSPILVHEVARATAIPRSLRSGVLADLTTLRRAEDPALIAATQQVWLAPGQHPAVLTRLRREGVVVSGVERTSHFVQEGLQSAANRAVLVSGFTAVAGVLFGFVAFAGTRVIDASARRRAWRTLRLSGVAWPALRRLATAEVAIPAVVAVLIGDLTGVGSAAMMAARLPLLSGDDPGPWLGPALSVPALALLALALLAGVIIVAATLAQAEVRGSRQAEYAGRPVSASAVGTNR